MDEGERPFELRFEDPFATPPGERDPARRLRGRLAAPVSIWTSGHGPRRTGLTVSSLLVAEGDPALVLGLISPVADLMDALRETGAFVVHVLDEGHRVLAERFSGARPGLGGVFGDLAPEDSPWGPLLPEIGTRASCRTSTITPFGNHELVEGIIEELSLAESARPLVFLRGRYRGLRPER